MIKVAEENDIVLSIGHQRHYSLLYAHALEVMNAGILGDVRYIRALWHRNNSFPRLDKDDKPQFENGVPLLRDSWRPEIRDEDRKALDGKIKKYGFKSVKNWSAGGSTIARAAASWPNWAATSSTLAASSLARSAAGRQRHRRQDFLQGRPRR